MCIFQVRFDHDILMVQKTRALTHDTAIACSGQRGWATCSGQWGCVTTICSVNKSKLRDMLRYVYLFFIKGNEHYFQGERVDISIKHVDPALLERDEDRLEHLQNL